MPTYRCYFLNSAGHFVGIKAMAAERDAEVPAAADMLLAASEYPAIEVWDLGRRVYHARKTRRSPIAKGATGLTLRPARALARYVLTR